MYLKNLSAVVLAVVLLGAGTAVSGGLTGRWQGSRHEIKAAAELLEKTPSSFGAWRATESHELTDNVQSILQCESYVHRTYINEQTGDVVSVAVILGPYGPICVHTPEVCYSSRNHTVAGKREILDFTATRAGSVDSVWKLEFEPNQEELGSMRVYYGWTRGDRITAAENARLAFAGSPYLYKLQLSCMARDNSHISNDVDSGQEFLEEFLPILHQHLLVPEKRWLGW